MLCCAVQHRATLKQLSAASCFRREVPLRQVTLLPYVMCHVMVRSGPSWFILLPCENGYLLIRRCAAHRGLTTSIRCMWAGSYTRQDLAPSQEMEGSNVLLSSRRLRYIFMHRRHCRRSAYSQAGVPVSRGSCKRITAGVRPKRLSVQVPCCASGFCLCQFLDLYFNWPLSKELMQVCRMKQLSRPPPSWKPRRPRPRLPPAGGGRRHRRDPRHHHRC